MNIREFIGILPFELWPIQKKILLDVYEGDYNKAFIVLGTRGGATTLSTVFALYECMIKPNNTLLAQTFVSLFSNCKESSKVQESNIRQINVCDPVKICEEMKFFNPFISHTSLGIRNTATILDAYDFYPCSCTKIESKRIFDNACNSAVLDNGKIIVVSGMQKPKSLLMEIYENYKEDPRTYSAFYNTWEINPNVTEEYLREEFKYNPTSFENYFAVH